MDSNHNTIKPYVIGFIFSILLTLAAYFAVTRQLFTSQILLLVILALALVQFMVQLIFFLHIGAETKPRWKLAVLVSTISIVLILVVGSIVIMKNLNYRMTPDQINQYMQNQAGGF